MGRDINYNLNKAKNRDLKNTKHIFFLLVCLYFEFSVTPSQHSCEYSVKKLNFLYEVCFLKIQVYMYGSLDAIILHF